MASNHREVALASQHFVAFLNIHGEAKGNEQRNEKRRKTLHLVMVLGALHHSPCHMALAAQPCRRPV
eukprot:1159650-Pelagomonas_calceolata.AAC.14